MKATSTIAATGLLALALSASHCGAKQAAIPSQAQKANAVRQGPPISREGGSELKSILAAARLPDLRWPDFSNYKENVAEIYRATSYQFVWLEHSRPTREALGMIRVLEDADTKGLVPADYDGERWAGRLAKFEQLTPPSESEMARFDVALTVSAMRYLYDLHLGRVDPSALHITFDVEPNKYDLARFLLVRIARSRDIQPALAEIEPPFPAYHRTIEALGRYRRLAQEYKGGPLPAPNKSVKPGDTYSALPQLTYLLRLLGDLPPDANVPSGNTYGGILVEAVRHFQLRHGLEPDGRLGRETFIALNTPLSYRVLQLQLTLERWRWLPHRFEQPPVIVNIPEFRLHVFDERGQERFAMKVVVGKAYGHKTPVFATMMDSVIFRPYWNVPYSIQWKELVPDVRKDWSYLIKNNYEVVDDRRRVVSGGTVNAELLEEIRKGTVHVRQRPGPKNSLGLIKFDRSWPARVTFSFTRSSSSANALRSRNISM